MVAAAAGIAAAAEAFKGAASAIAAKEQAKATKYSSKKNAKETKRKTLADLFNEALKREHESGQSGLQRQQEYRGDRAKSLQNLASQYVQALR